MNIDPSYYKVRKREGLYHLTPVWEMDESDAVVLTKVIEGKYRFHPDDMDVINKFIAMGLITRKQDTLKATQLGELTMLSIQDLEGKQARARVGVSA